MTPAAATTRAIAAVLMIAAFGFELLGVPGCSIAADQPAGALRRVERLIAARELAGALPLALENRTRYPGDPVAAWHVARVYQGLGALVDEASAWEVYLRKSPPTSDVCLRLSDVYHELAQPAQVVATADRCLALDDRQAELLGDLAAAYVEMGNRAAAITALERALAIDPVHPRFRAQLRNLEGAGP